LNLINLMAWGLRLPLRHVKPLDEAEDCPVADGVLEEPLGPTYSIEEAVFATEEELQKLLGLSDR